MENRRARNIAWGLTWVAYATYYTGRKGFSVAKKSVQDQLGVTEAALGIIDTVYLGAYALGQFVSGMLGDRIGARRLVSYGMLLSAGACVGFGASSGAVLFGAFFLLNGLAQSTGWPGTTRAMAEWTTRKNRGTVMAFWATCYQVGGIVATVAAGWLLGTWGWRSAFFGPAVFMTLVAVAVLLLLKSPSAATLDEFSVTGRPSSRPRSALLKNPVLWCYGASYLFIKFIRYTLLFWLPYYLSTQLDYPEDRAAYVSAAFEVGGVVGVIGMGIVSDRVARFSRSAVAAWGLFALALALFVYSAIGELGVVFNVLGLGLVGAMLFGPDALLSGAAAQDAGGKQAAATATGFVNGVGSIGAILEGLIVPHVGWDILLPTLGVLAFCATLALLPTLRRAPAPRSIP